MALLDPPLNWQNLTLERLWNTLIDAYISEQEVRDLADFIGIRSGTFPTNKPDMRAVWKALLDELASQNRLRLLIERAKAEKEAPNFQAVFLEALDRHDNPVARALNDRVFTANMAVLLLDREPLRKQLALLEPDGNAEKVLLVRGERKSGKTWGQYLFDHVARARGAKSVFLDGAIAPNVKEVIDQLFSALNASSEIPFSETTDAAYYRAVCRKLKEIAARQNLPLWIAQDDIGVDANGVALPDSDIKLFFDQFAAMTRNQDFWPWFRLMLINYPDKPVPPEWKQENWIEDRPSRTAVTSESVIAFIESWAAARGLNLVEDEAKTIAKEIIDKGDTAADPMTRLQIIHQELKARLAAGIGTAP